MIDTQDFATQDFDSHEQDHPEHGTVRLLRLNHPPANALGPKLFDALLDLLGTLEKDAKQPGGPRAAVLSGRPGMFSAGLDVPHLLTLGRPALAKAWRQFYTILRALAASPVPIIASITGHSPAGGAVLSLFCDYRIMAGGKFRIGLNEVRVGLALPEVILETLQHTVGHHRAALLASTGSLLTAQEAHRLGLIDEVVEVEKVEVEGDDKAKIAEAVEERALAFARQLANLPLHARDRTRSMARRHLVKLIDEGKDRDTDVLIDEWFRQDTQRRLTELVESLGQKR